MTLNIRQATLTDSALLKELGYSLYPAHFKQMWASESEMNDFLQNEYSISVIEQSMQDSNICWYVAEAGRPIGFMKLTWESRVPDSDISGVLLNKLYLDPEETDKGYGQLIFDKITELVRQNGKNYLWLEVLEQNKRARSFYQKQGMRDLSDIIFETASQRSVLKIMGMSV